MQRMARDLYNEVAEPLGAPLATVPTVEDTVDGLIEAYLIEAELLVRLDRAVPAEQVEAAHHIIHRATMIAPPPPPPEEQPQ